MTKVNQLQIEQREVKQATLFTNSHQHSIYEEQLFQDLCRQNKSKAQQLAKQLTITAKLI